MTPNGQQRGRHAGTFPVFAVTLRLLLPPSESPAPVNLLSAPAPEKGNTIHTMLARGVLARTHGFFFKQRVGSVLVS